MTDTTPTLDGLTGDDYTRAKNIKRSFIVDYEENHGKRPSEKERQMMEEAAVDDVRLSKDGVCGVCGTELADAHKLDECDSCLGRY